MNRFINIARAAAFAGLCSGCIVWSAAAFAADYDPAPQGTIVIHGADLTSPRTVSRLQRRLRHVAADICTAHSGGTILMSRSEQACYDTALKDGLTQIAGRQQQALQQPGITVTRPNTPKQLSLSRPLA